MNLKTFKVMKANQRVRLITFNGTVKSPKAVIKSENYWKLIGESGTIQKSPKQNTIYASFSSEPRVLVKFGKDLIGMGLTAHNEIANSLWILVSDLAQL